MKDDLPEQLSIGAAVHGTNEYGWSVDSFPEALRNAPKLGFACIGGQFQFRTPTGTCEMYWLNADSSDRRAGESWADYAARSCKEVGAAFQTLLSATDFGAEAKRWKDVPELSGASASPEQYLCFVAYFVDEFGVSLTEVASLIGISLSGVANALKGGQTEGKRKQ